MIDANGFHLTLIETIRYVFPPSNMVYNIAPDADEEEEKNIDRMLSSKKWSDLDAETLRDIDRKLLVPLLTPSAFCYYLPAFFVAFLSNRISCGNLDSIISTLNQRRVDIEEYKIYNIKQEQTIRRALSCLCREMFAAKDEYCFMITLACRIRSLIWEKYHNVDESKSLSAKKSVQKKSRTPRSFLHNNQNLLPWYKVELDLGFLKQMGDLLLGIDDSVLIMYLPCVIANIYRNVYNMKAKEINKIITELRFHYLDRSDISEKIGSTGRHLVSISLKYLTWYASVTR
jgi:hypothetical protein